MLIKNCVNLSDDELEQIISIFYETSAKKSFIDDHEKRIYQFNYLDYYLEHYSDLCFIAIDGEKVLGYVLSSPNTDYHLKNMDYYIHFKDELAKYPSHLHINCTKTAQGHGVGSKLWTELRTRLIADCIKGLHIITTENSYNVNFYLKNSFQKISSVKLKGYELLLMAVNF